MAYYVARFILLKLRLKFQQPIAGEERHEWGFRFPGLGTTTRKEEKGEPPCFRSMFRRREKRTAIEKKKNLQEGESEPPCKRPTRKRLRGLLNWVKSNQDGTQKLVSNNGVIDRK